MSILCSIALNLPVTAHHGELTFDLSTRSAHANKALLCVAKMPVFRHSMDIFGSPQEKEEEENSNACTRRHGKSRHTLLASLKACTEQRDLRSGSEVHDYIAKNGLLEDVLFGSALVNMYAKCGGLAKAQEVFDNLQCPNEVSWNALISGYVQNGDGEQALKCFESMQVAGLTPNAATFSCILKACGLTGAVEKGKEIHAEIIKQGFLDTNVVVANALIDMYVKCGLLVDAQGVFDKLSVRDVVSWSTLVKGYAHHSLSQEAFHYFEQMQVEGSSPDEVTFLSALKACGNMGAVDKGQEIHGRVVAIGLPEKDLIGTALVDMYAKCGLLSDAHELFDRLPERNIVSWTALITGYAQHGLAEEALSCSDRMQCEGLFPNTNTCACILKACGTSSSGHKGQQVHAVCLKGGFLDKDVVVGTALVDMYAKCGAISKAQELFDELPFRNVFSWNAMVVSYAQLGYNEEAMTSFDQMQLEGFSPDAVTLACILKVCGRRGTEYEGQKIHLLILKGGLLENNLSVANALVDMYAKCGLLGKAQEVFDDLPECDVVSWNALVAGYTLHGFFEEALKCSDRMQLEGFHPDAGTYHSILKACSSIGAVDMGLRQHAKIMREGWLAKDIAAGTLLVEMYARVGMLSEAQEMFNKFTIRDVVSWNAVIEGFAQAGKDEAVFNLFNKMKGEGKQPNTATFALILNTCSHRGLLDEGLSFFEMLTVCHGSILSLEHYTCMVDLFGRAGHLHETLAIVEEIPFAIDFTLWQAVLSACQKWENAVLGSVAFKKASQLDEMDVAAYVCLYNLYAAVGKQEDIGDIKVSSYTQQVLEDIAAMPAV